MKCCVNCILGLAYTETTRHNPDCMTPTSKQSNVLNNAAERIYVEKQHFVTQCSSFRMPVCGKYTNRPMMGTAAGVAIQDNT